MKKNQDVDRVAPLLHPTESIREDVRTVDTIVLDLEIDHVTDQENQIDIIETIQIVIVNTLITTQKENQMSLNTTRALNLIESQSLK